jgi:hypothetical protein
MTLYEVLREVENLGLMAMTLKMNSQLAETIVRRLQKLEKNLEIMIIDEELARVR